MRTSEMLACMINQKSSRHNRWGCVSNLLYRENNIVDPVYALIGRFWRSLER